MARKKPPLKAKQMATVLALVMVFVFAVLIIFVPGLEQKLYDFIGAVDPDIEVAQQLDGDTKIHVIDVGQGDATLLEQEGKYALVDAGPPEAKDDLLAYIDALGITQFEYVIMTHPHADHYGGMQSIVEKYSIGLLVLPDFEKAPVPTSQMFIRLLEAIDQNNISVKTAQEGDVYPVGSGEIRILQAGIAGKDYNLLSLMMIFEAEGIKAMITGDAEKANEKALLESGQDIRADILVAGHHGSSTCNSKNFVNAVNPAIVAISCSANNSYGHPHKEPMQNFNKVADYVFRTDLDGTAVFAVLPNGSIGYNTEAMLEEEHQNASTLVLGKYIFLERKMDKCAFR